MQDIYSHISLRLFQHNAETQHSPSKDNASISEEANAAPPKKKSLNGSSSSNLSATATPPSRTASVPLLRPSYLAEEELQDSTEAAWKSSPLDAYDGDSADESLSTLRPKFLSLGDERDRNDDKIRCGFRGGVKVSVEIE